MHIFIEPIDVLLFRDGRPFAAGEDHRAVSLFPPTPLTLQGAIRSKILADKGISYAIYASGSIKVPEIGYGDDYGQLHLRGPLVARKEEGRIVRYFPLPADVVAAVCSHPIVLNPLSEVESPFETNPSYDGVSLCLLWQRTTEHIEAEIGWLSEAELQRYLSGQPFAVARKEELFDHESRFHVGIDSQFKRPHQGDMGGHLYQIEFIWLQPGVGLWLEVNGVSLPESGLLQLGGEGKAAIYRKLDDMSVPAAGRTVRDRFKLYFATPAYFAHGWQPDDWGKFFAGSKVRLIAAAVPRTLTIGGFDIAHGQHKPMRCFVPAGSVFFFESDHEVTVSDVITDEARLGQIGFGQAFVGRWEYV